MLNHGLAPTSTALTALHAALAAFANASGDPLPQFIGLVDALRPPDPRDTGRAHANHTALLTALRENEAWRLALRDAFLQLLATRRHVRFFAAAGILPNSGFFSELARRVQDRLLPEAPDPLATRDVARMVFRHPLDHLWLDAIPADEARAFWSLLDLGSAPDLTPLRHVLVQMLDAVQVLGHRVSAMGLEPELLRVLPELDAQGSPFLALSTEVHRALESLRATLPAQATATLAPAGDDSALRSLLTRCRELVRRARRIAAAEGTSLQLTYLLVRLEQSLVRMEALLRLLATRAQPDAAEAATGEWSAFFRTAIRGENQRNSVRLHWARMTSLLALRVTENAGRTGEHYITSDREGWLLMWRAAMGAGVIIPVMALLKIYAHELDLAPLNQAFVYSMNYGIGFMLVHVLHFAIATKQPAMTAATIAAAVGEAHHPDADLGRLADLVVDVLRTQLAAILGNVLVALPVAMAIALSLGAAAGQPLVTPEQALHLLHDIHPFASLALPHAAVAGVCLFLSGLISGYFDNHASYARVPERVARLPWLVKLRGAEGARRFGDWLGQNLGGLSGNFLFGVMLGTIGTLGMLVGLPIDIRHIAFSSANLGYAMVTLQGTVPWTVFAWGALGVALIGLVNLTVSFSLALWVALRSRDVRFTRTGELLKLLAQRFRHAPARFFLPPRTPRTELA